jgi:Asp-tRNA(Asn)/Glu-tRNA(Gln) amidotransferase A subunit family amidase
MSLSELSGLVRKRQVSSVDLTRLYLERLRAWDDVLECVISITEERAMAAAERADREIAAGNYLGPLHGIPWGAKDLLAARGYRTTWGANPYKDQVITEDAEVVRRLESAGAILVAKLTLGALAWGDVWFGGVTKNPWKVEQGSSGSSAGSASATAAGLVGFAVGSETWGSIVSPSTRCGTTGLRPTFGRVSRAGAMALSWSMDKLGPICRSVEDCAHVFAAIHGADGVDPAAVDRPFSWRREIDPKAVRIGYLKSVFERTGERLDTEWMGFDSATLKTLEGLGFTLVPMELPDFPVNALSFILSVEAAAAFDELTMSGRDELLVRQVKDAWPNVFRQARLIPAVEYVQANRARWMLMQQMAETLKEVDVWLSPSFAGNNLLLTNLTGHPCVVLPNGFRADGTPTSITFNGRLYGEETLLAVANMYQQATDFHRQHPDLPAQRAKLKATGA